MLYVTTVFLRRATFRRVENVSSETTKGDYMSRQNETAHATSGAGVTRRTFMKATGALAAVAAGGTVVANTEEFAAHADETQEEDKCVWSACHINCEGRCALRLHVKNDEIYRVETDNTGNDEYGDHQVRACQRGRSIRRWINDENRLKYPLKRVGKRGSGEFEQISWDEAASIIADNYQRVLDQYGPEAVFIQYATGVQAGNIRNFVKRLCCLNGGYLSYYGSYSSAQISRSIPFLYGKKDGNANSDIKNSKLVVQFGENAVENKMSGGGAGFHLTQALERGDAKVIVIDPRYSDQAATRADQWIPIRPGTDAALVDGLAYVMITEDLVDHDFLDTYCIGYDESTMPESAKGKNASYKDYILGNGADKTPKTPEWASEITRVPVKTIEDLAREIATTKPCGIFQGKGMQRHANGEQAARAVCMLAVLTGNVGIAGGNTGSEFGDYGNAGISVPMEKNQVKASIPVFNWLNAVDHGEQMTKLHDGVQNVDKLNQPIKFIWNYGGNCISNQHGEINRVHEILEDESKCEFIVTWDIMMTDSAKCSDIVLPDAMPQEQPTYFVNEYGGNMGYSIMGQAATEPKYERKTLYAALTMIADKLGCKDEFTEGRDEEQWLEYMYNKMLEKDKLNMPSYEDAKKQGVIRRRDPEREDGHIAFKTFRDDPIANPLKTPSGKIEIYSEQLAEIADTWELDEKDIINPLPVYAPENGGYLDATDETPLQMIGYHFKGHVHSSYTQVEILKQANRQRQLWINPADAEVRNLKDGDDIYVQNGQGTMKVQAHVTQRIVPGCVALDQGAWYSADKDGVDVGGCINTLTSGHPSPLAKANPSHTILVEVKKA